MRVPLRARWPGGIPAAGVVCDKLWSQIDFFATFVELLGAESAPNAAAQGMDSVSMLPYFTSPDRACRSDDAPSLRRRHVRPRGRAAAYAALVSIWRRTPAGGKYDAMLQGTSARGARYVNLSSNPWEEDESGHEQAAQTSTRRGEANAASAPTPAAARCRSAGDGGAVVEHQRRAPRGGGDRIAGGGLGLAGRRLPRGASRSWRAAATTRCALALHRRRAASASRRWWSAAASAGCRPTARATRG